jgi:hypothetical protein
MSVNDGSTARQFVAISPRLKKSVIICSYASFAAVYPLMFVVHSAVGGATGRVVFFLVVGGLGLFDFLAFLRWGMYKKIPICVTIDGLTVDKRPGDFFSFADAKLGLWTPGGRSYTVTMSGTALHLRCGPHQFVLGGRDHRTSTGTRLEAPPTGGVDGWLWAADFDEVLTMVGRRPGLDVSAPAAGEPIRCLLFMRPSMGAFTAPLRSIQKVNPQPSLAIDLGTDKIRVIDPKSNALVASAAFAQVTATPGEYNYWGMTTPVLVVCVPGVQPLTIGCPQTRASWQSRFAWRGGVSSEREPEFMVSDGDWRALVEEFGLAPCLHESRELGF